MGMLEETPGVVPDVLKPRVPCLPFKASVYTPGKRHFERCENAPCHFQLYAFSRR